MSLLDRTASILGRGRLLPCTCFFHGLLVRRERVQVLCVADLLHGVVLPSIDDDVDALHVGVHFNSLSFPKSCVFTHFLFEAFISIHLPLKSLSFHLQSGIFSIIDGRLLELPEDPSISAFGNNAWKNELGENEFDNSRGFY